jgi:Lrp/AsnC family transcriptional regulator for asnA, asnC and gidA
MDQIDNKILRELEVKGYQKPADLAPRIGIGAEAIRRRINEMRATGDLFVVAMPNPISLGYRAWAHIGIKVGSGYLDRVTAELLKYPSVYWIAYSLSQYDIWIATLFKSLTELGFFINSELTRIEGIIDTEKSVFTHVRKYYRFSWPAPVFKRTGSGLAQYPDAAEKNNYQIDETDRKILDILTEDGLTSTANLKARLGVGERTIRKRINNMHSRQLFTLEVVPNLERLAGTMVYLGIVVKEHSAQEVADTIVKKSSVYFTAEAIGRHNLIVMARFEDTESANHFITVELPEIAGIASIEPFLYTKVIKLRGIHLPYSRR